MTIFVDMGIGKILRSVSFMDGQWLTNDWPTAALSCQNQMKFANSIIISKFDIKWDDSRNTFSSNDIGDV